MRRNKLIYGFSERLEAAMAASGKSPDQIALETGISRSAIYSYLSGDSTPSAFYIGKIAVCLKVSSDWLIGIEKSPPSN